MIEVIDLCKSFGDLSVLKGINLKIEQGAVSLGTYETSSALKKAGAVSGLDMTTEAAVAKLYYLFSCGYDKEKIKQTMEENLRGEISVS